MRIIQELHAIIHWCDEQLENPDLSEDKIKELEAKREQAEIELNNHL